MNILLFGASGMVGMGVLMECLDHPDVTHVTCVVRKPLDMSHPKLREVIHDDFLDYEAIADDLKNMDACFWCLGVSSIGMSEEDYRRITYDFTLAGARAVLGRQPGMSLQLRFRRCHGQLREGASDVGTCERQDGERPHGSPIRQCNDVPPGVHLCP